MAGAVMIARALGLADAGQLQQLWRVHRAGADHDLARDSGLARITAHGIADAGAALAVEDEGLGQRAGLDMQVMAVADRVQIAPAVLIRRPAAMVAWLIAMPSWVPPL
jgi:hypothetical protein